MIKLYLVIHISYGFGKNVNYLEHRYNCTNIYPYLDLLNVSFGQFFCLLFMEGLTSLILCLFFASKIRSGLLCPFLLYLTVSLRTWKSKQVYQIPFVNNLNLRKHTARKYFKIFSQEIIRIKSTSESLLKLSIRLQTCYMKNWKEVNMLYVHVCYFWQIRL